ncbi:hypothetical protein CFC21_088032 [Triticum aestivum]|uniref:Gamma carbonic anhydrase-like 2, mitochondrial n=3 Tax=Triticum TaxID=4564 RepID=A0A9R0YKX8_TRITD|nr:hypothetical protein CFC21_088032 [Triticum aestivum]VAI57371.1 unnamed protein product [Triticum turgidum subsp. durum]
MAAASLSRLSRRASATAAPSLRRILSSTATAPAAPSSSPPPVAAAAAGADRVRWDYRGQRQLVPLGQWLPKVAVDAYVAPDAVLAGQVTVHDGASVWSGSVLRGDLNKITLGFCANVQERSVLHAAWSASTGLPAETLVDRYVTVGAYCLLRSCTIEPECIIGRRIPTGELWAGNPARFVRKLTNEEIMEIPKLAVAINDLMQSHFSEFLPYSNAYLEVEKLKKSFSIPL